MENNVFLSVRGTQRYGNDAPEVIELATEGCLWREDDLLHLSYMETELTGLAGTRTEFIISPEKVVLERSGAFRSRMVFELGTYHKSLYDTGMGSLLISICATSIENHMDETGGNLRVSYIIEIEDTGVGVIEYYIVAAKL